MNIAQKIRQFQRAYREELRRAGLVACSFALLWAVSNMAIGYYIVMQQWFVDAATISTFDNPVSRPNLWDGEFNIEGGVWGFFLALATTGVGIYVYDKLRNYIRTGTISSTTEPAMQKALGNAVFSLVQMLPGHNMLQARMTYVGNGAHDLIVAKLGTTLPTIEPNGHHPIGHGLPAAS